MNKSKILGALTGTVLVAAPFGMSLPTAAAAPVTMPANVQPMSAPQIIAKKGQSSTVTKNVQTYLWKLGYMKAEHRTGYFGSITEAAVKRYQKNNKLSQSGTVNQGLYNRMKTAASKVKTPSPKLDKRCLTGRAICIDKGDRKMYWVVNGKVKATYPVRTGRAGMDTRTGQFKVYAKHKNWYSTLYHVNMPYTQFFSGGQAVHYSSEFANYGYSNGGSHGCVNMNSRASASWLYSQTRVGDKVIVTN